MEEFYSQTEYMMPAPIPGYCDSTYLRSSEIKLRIDNSGLVGYLDIMTTVIKITHMLCFIAQML